MRCQFSLRFLQFLLLLLGYIAVRSTNACSSLDIDPSKNSIWPSVEFGSVSKDIELLKYFTVSINADSSRIELSI